MSPSLGSNPNEELFPSREPAPGRPLRRRKPSSGSLLDFVTILFRQLPLVSALFVSTVLGTVVWMMIEPENYEVSARIMLRFAREAADPRTSLSPTTTRVLPAVRPDINTEAELIKSYALVEQVVVNLGLDKPYVRPVPRGLFPRMKYELRRAYNNIKEALDEVQIAAGLKERLSPKEIAIVKLMTGLKVESVRDSSVVKATLTTSIRTDSSKILNSLLEAYRERRLAVEKNSREIAFFGNQAAESRRDLLNSENRLDELKRKHNVASLPDQISLALKDVSETERGVKDIQSQVAASEAKVRALEAQMAEQPKSRVVNQTDSRNSALDSLIQRRDALELDKQKTLGKFGPDHPEIKSLDEQLARVGKLIEETQASVPQSQTTAVNSIYLELEKDLLTAKQTLDAERAQLSAKTAAYNEYRAQLELLRDAQVAHNQLSREVSIGEDAYKLNERNAMEARAAEVLRSQGISSIEIVDPAIDPILPAGIRKIYLLGSAVLVGIILAIGAAVLIDSLDHSLHTPANVEQYSGLDVLGCIGYARKVSAIIPPRGRYATEFSQIGSKLERRYGRGDGGVKVFAICGASGASGPELVGAGIAHVFSADWGYKTLVAAVDRQLDHYVRLFGKEGGRPGEAAPASIDKSLDVVSIGGNDQNPVELARRIRSLAADFPGYDRVLIDLGTAPPQPWIAAADQASDGIVLVLGADSTRREVLQRWEQVARAEDYRVSGAVLNGRRYPIPGFIYRWWS